MCIPRTVTFLAGSCDFVSIRFVPATLRTVAIYDINNLGFESGKRTQMSPRSTILTFLFCLFVLAISLPSVQAIPPRKAQQLQHAKLIPSGRINKKWVPPAEGESVAPKRKGMASVTHTFTVLVEDQPTANINVNAHAKCESTTMLVECRDTCYTTYGPYSNFYDDCLDCCRKV